MAEYRESKTIRVASPKQCFKHNSNKVEEEGCFNRMIREHTPLDRKGCKMLCSSLLYRLLDDLNHKEHRSTALYFMQTDLFEVYCALAEVNSDRIRSKAYEHC